MPNRIFVFIATLVAFITSAYAQNNYASPYTFTTLAGIGWDADGPATVSSFRNPLGVAIDGSGNIYVADAGNNKIRKITATGVVTTLAGSGSVGRADGTGVDASFNGPSGIAVDRRGDVYVGDAGNNKIRKITASGVVTTLAGSGSFGSSDGTGAESSFYGPSGIAVDDSGNVYVVDRGNNKIRKITRDGVVSTVADNYGTPSSVVASFKPDGVAVDSVGNLYVADGDGNKIRKITAAGLVTTFAGSGNAGFADGLGAEASFSCPIGVAVDGSGNVYVAEYFGQKIRKITAAGVVSTLAGSNSNGSAEGTGAAARFDYPWGVAVDGSGNTYVADTNNHSIRKITPAGVVSTFAGSGSARSSDGRGAVARFDLPNGVAVDSSGNVYVADYNNAKVRKITAAGLVTTLAGSGIIGSANGTGSAASFYSPAGVAVDGRGNLYIADQFNNKIRKITAAGVVTTLAGSGSEGKADGKGAAASFRYPKGVAVDGRGNVYVADGFNNLIRKITAAGVVTTLAGSGSAGSADGTGSAASFRSPSGVAVDSSGNVFVADTYNHKIRKITPGGVVTTLAGSGSFGVSNADGTGSAASFAYPTGVAVDGSGNVYVADQGNHNIRIITAAGVVTTIAGSSSQGNANGTGANARFASPTGVAVDGIGNVYVADTFNNTIRQGVPPASPPAITSLLAANGSMGVAFSYTITAKNNPTSYGATGLPPGLNLNPDTGSITGIPSLAGAFPVTLSANNEAGTGTAIATFAIAAPAPAAPVFITQPAPQSVIAGANVTFYAVASGYPSPIFQWFKDGAALPGQTSDTFTVTQVQIGHAGSYTVKATNASAPNGITSMAAKLSVSVPQPAQLTPASYLLGDRVSPLSLAEIQTYPAGIKFYTSALPSGLTVDTNNGLISGVITGKAGKFTISYWTQLGTTKSATRRFVLTVGPFPTALTGNFETLLDDSAAGGNPALPAGKVSLAVSATGTFTGTLTTGDVSSYSISGSMELSGDHASGFKTLIISRSPTNYFLTLRVSIDGKLTANLATEDELLASGTGVRSVTKTTAATYTMILHDPTNLGSMVTIPQGDGYLSVTRSTAGVFTLKGKTADGAIVSTTAELGSDNQLRIYAKPYAAAGGYLAGTLAITARNDKPSLVHVTAEGGSDLYWNKPNDPGTLSYPAGFGPVALEALMEPWQAKGIGALLNLPTSGNFSVDIGGDYLSNFGPGADARLPQTLNLNAKNVLSVVGTNASSWMLKLNPTTGVFTGTCKLASPLPTRTVIVEGILFQPAPGGPPMIGGGYLLVPKPDGAQLIFSGLIELSTP